MADLRTDYKDDLLDTSVNTQRKYRQVDNGDGTVSFVDETVYAQNGDTFGASEVNQIHAAVNLVNDSLSVDTTNLSEDFSLKGLLQKLAEKYFPAIRYFLKNGHFSNIGSISTGGVISYSLETNALKVSTKAPTTEGAEANGGTLSIPLDGLENYNKLSVTAHASADSGNSIFRIKMCYVSSSDGSTVKSVLPFNGTYYNSIPTESETVDVDLSTLTEEELSTVYLELLTSTNYYFAGNTLHGYVETIYAYKG